MATKSKKSGVTKRNPKSVQPYLSGVSADARYPSWNQVKAAFSELPDGWRTELSQTLNVNRSAITHLFARESQPSYSRVIDCIRFLERKGVHLG